MKLEPEKLCGRESLKPSSSRATERLPGRLLHRNVAQTVYNLKHPPTTPNKRRHEKRRKVALNSPCACEGREKCANVRKVSFFSAFLRGSESTQLAKLVRQQNLFRDLGFFSPPPPKKNFFFPDKSKGVYLEEGAGEQGMWNNRIPGRRGVKSRGKGPKCSF